MKLISIRKYPDSERFLYKLLKERDGTINIHHTKLPSYRQHCKFIRSAKRDWYIILVHNQPVGTVYLTDKNELGIFISKSHQGHGYSTIALNMIRQEHPRDQYLAHINPLNKKSRQLFSKLGFTLIEETYEWKMR